MKQPLSLLKDRVLVSDGAIGTMLQLAGLPPGGCPDEMNISKPKVVQDIHKAYVEAGAQLITTNTFGGNSMRLRQFGLQAEIEPINSKGVELAKKAAQGKAFVAGSIGPTGGMLEPFGDIGFDEAYRIYFEQAQILSKAGCDLLTIETMTDLREVKAAVLACRDASSLPVCAQLSFEEGGRTVTGTDASTAAVLLASLGVTLLGSNCGSSLSNMAKVIETMGQEVSTPTIAQPNAGIPQIVQGKAVYDAEPAEMAQFARQFVEAGANVVGSCCGSTPEHTKAISESVKGMKPGARKLRGGTKITSRTKTAYLGQGHPFLLVGERINPTGRNGLTSEIKEGNLTSIREEALEQAKQGAGALDVNVCVEEIEEAEIMQKAISQIQNLTDTPLFIDSPNPHVVEAGLKVYVGKPVVNSVTGDRKRLEEILPLIKRYGASVVALCLDEKGVRESPEERLSIAESILKVAKEYGVPEEDIIFDPVVLTAASSQELARTTVRTIQLLKESLGVTTIAGVSNISHGLPHRSLLNRSFLEMAIGAGLDSGIGDPGQEGIREAVLAGELLVGRDRGGRRFISHFQARHKEEKEEGSLYEHIVLGASDNLKDLVGRLVEEGETPLGVIEATIVPALKEVGERFERGDYFLPEVISSARAAEEAISLLKPLIGEGGEGGRGRVVIATVRGDIHDIGKNLVATMLRSHNYEVIDLGKDVESDVIAQTALEKGADIVALSALMTTTMVTMQEVGDLLGRASFKGRMLVGGAVVTEDFAEKIGAVYGKDALEAVRKVEALLKEGDRNG